jgi:hypothetical protein
VLHSGAPWRLKGARGAIPHLIAEIKLTPVEGVLTVEIRGALARKLSFCSDRTKAALDGETVAEQTKMVAAACKHRSVLWFKQVLT